MELEVRGDDEGGSCCSAKSLLMRRPLLCVCVVGGSGGLVWEELVLEVVPMAKGTNQPALPGRASGPFNIPAVDCVLVIFFTVF